jgi:broad specificity phosphatase PhoE
VAHIEPGVGEIASPTSELAGRAEWLRHVMSSRWPDLEPGLRSWRQNVLDTLCAFATPTVVFTHFIAINVAVGAATGQDPVVCFAPDNASRTVIDVIDGRLHLITRGAPVSTAPGEAHAAVASDPMVQ